jgi:DNA-binding CsgD family transcriptional regulator
VSALRQSDLCAVLDFLREAEEVKGPSPFPASLVGRLGELVPSDVVHFCELDRVRQRALGDVYATDSDECDDGGTYWRLRHEHPTCWHHEQTGDFSAHKVSDFLTLRELRRLEIYEHRFRVFPFELTVGLPAPPWHTKVFLFHRRNRDFQERDLRVLDLLRPHLVHLWESAKTRRIADALAAGAEVPGELVVYDSAYAVEHATGAARRLLSSYFGDRRPARLPPLLEEWLLQGRRRDGESLPRPGKPLTIERGDRRLVVSRLGGDSRAVLLTEEAVPDGSKPLSFREWQVVGLVEEGKPNAEIAAELWISPGTVRTHLEHIYAKLGVRSRTAALARVRELKRAQSA